MAESGLLPQIVLGPVQAGVGDEHPRVRYAALTCLGQMTEDYGDWGGGEVEEDEEEGGGSFQGTFHAQVRGAEEEEEEKPVAAVMVMVMVVVVVVW